MNRYLSSPLLLILTLTISACDFNAVPVDEERELLLADRDFAHLRKGRGGHYSKNVQYLTRTVELSYTHNTDDNFYLYSAVTIYPTAGDALVSGYAGNFGASYSLKSNGLEKRALALSPGHAKDSSLDLLTRGGEPVGNLFFTRVANKSVFILFTGVYFEQAEQFEDFIAPRLQRIHDFKPRDPLVTWAGGLFGGSSQPKNQ
ncbi:hypothetical protein M2262_000145 [Pseudomonas sp. BIGb0408]|uniref:Lipoprotein n=1 Tax=Phytopseudomonas flavescens TaxID=29435 RepID=A0A7Y9XSK3_9GAMM|nr:MULTISPECIES: hypothetical protein [Pseudomonas]MCW2290095.1 hypothetical protein [Pseudomonas sp. BIGb0408]NYH75332.1 hypothetical protein [Pseudomonas flavescens]